MRLKVLGLLHRDREEKGRERARKGEKGTERDREGQKETERDRKERHKLTNTQYARHHSVNKSMNQSWRSVVLSEGRDTSTALDASGPSPDSLGLTASCP